MKAKDTVMTISQAKQIILDKHCSPETTARDIAITDIEQALLEAQAEISFKLISEDVQKMKNPYNQPDWWTPREYNAFEVCRETILISILRGTIK